MIPLWNVESVICSIITWCLHGWCFAHKLNNQTNSHDLFQWNVIFFWRNFWEKGRQLWCKICLWIQSIPFKLQFYLFIKHVWIVNWTVEWPHFNSTLNVRTSINWPTFSGSLNTRILFFIQCSVFDQSRIWIEMSINWTWSDSFFSFLHVISKKFRNQTTKGFIM